MTDLEQLHNTVRREATIYGSKKLVNPYSALLDEVQWRAGHVAALRDRLADITDIDQLTYYDDNGVARDVSVLRRYDRERELLDRVCKLAISAGIAERYVQLAELQGATLARVMNRALDKVGLSAEQRRILGPALRDAIAEEQRLQAEATGTVELARPNR